MNDIIKISNNKRAECVSRMAENIGKALSSYCSAHPEEARPLFAAEDERESSP